MSSFFRLFLQTRRRVSCFMVGFFCEQGNQRVALKVRVLHSGVNKDSRKNGHHAEVKRKSRNVYSMILI